MNCRKKYCKGLVFNGRFVKYPYGARYIRSRMSLKKYLKDIRSRLVNEVGFLMEIINDRNKKKPWIGFFALTRMIMPIVDTIARTEGLSGAEFLSKLGMPHPTLTWALYRNVFMHNDEFQVGKVGKRGVPAGLLISTPEQEELSTYELLRKTYFLDIGALYRRIVKYLDKRIIEVSPTKKVDYISGIWYPASGKLGSTIRAELKEHDTCK